MYNKQLVLGGNMQRSRLWEFGVLGVGGLGVLSFQAFSNPKQP